MFFSDLYGYADAASDDREIGVVVCHAYTGKEVAVSYDVVADVSEHGELMICIAVEPFD
jgi:hypothetical protein